MAWEDSFFGESSTRCNSKIKPLQVIESAENKKILSKPNGRLAGVVPARTGQAPSYNSSAHMPHFVTGMPLGEQIARQVTATDQTSRAIHCQRLEAEARIFFRPAKLPRRRQ
jgi:hypothetical protein